MALSASSQFLSPKSDGWLGSSAASPQEVTFWGLAALDPSHPFLAMFSTLQMSCSKSG